jgi:hypothetical protein
LARIQRLCCLGIGSELLMPDLLQEVSGLIPFRGGSFRWLGPGLEVTNIYSTFPTLLEFYLTQLHLKRPYIILRRTP